MGALGSIPGGVQHGAQGQAEVVVGQRARIGTGETDRHPLWRFVDVRDHRRRQLDLGDAVEVEGHRRAQLREQVVDRRGVTDRIGFEREAVPVVTSDARRKAVTTTS